MKEEIIALHSSVLKHLNSASLARMTAVSKLMKKTIQANKSLAKKVLTEKKRIDSLRKAVNTGLKIPYNYPTTRSNIKRGKVIRRNIRLASPSNAARKIKIPENADYFRKIDATVRALNHVRKLPKNNMVRENNTNGRRAFSFNANKQRYTLLPNGTLQVSYYRPGQGMITRWISTGVKLSNILSKSNRRKMFELE